MKLILSILFPSVVLAISGTLDLGNSFFDGSGLSSVTVSAPLISSAGNDPNLSCGTASASSPGCLSAADFSLFSNKENSLSFTAPLSRSTNTISIPVATSSSNGYLSSANWSTFNNKFTLPSFSSGSIIFSNGTTLVQNTSFPFSWDNTNFRLNIGAPGAGKVNITSAGGTDLGLNVFSTSSNNAAQIQNQSAYTLSLVNAAASATAGSSIGGSFSRGTLAARTQSLSGDQVFSITGQGYTGSAFGPGITNAISFVLSQNTTSSANGGEIVLATTRNGALLPTERLRIKQSGETTLVNSHLKSTQTTVPIATVNANAGTGATCSIANATDMAGKITVTTGTIGVSTGAYCSIAFNLAYVVAPICVLTPAGSSLSSSVYVTSSTSSLQVNFAIAGGISTTYIINYCCMETQT